MPLGALTATFLITMFAFGGPSAEPRPAAGESKPIAVTPADVVEFRVTQDQWYGTLDTTYKATAVVLLSGPAADEARFALTFRNGTTRTLDPKNLGSTDGVVRWQLRFDTSNRDPVAGFLIVTSKADAQPIIIPVKVKVLVATRLFLNQALLLLFLSSIFLVSLFLLLPEFTVAGFRQTLPGLTKSKWDFRDSWASNLVALGSVTGLVLGVSGTLTDLMPGLSAAPFVLVTLCYGFLALTAPAVYKMLSRDGEGTIGGLAVAATFTTASVVGLIATLTLLLHRGGVTRWVTMPVGLLVYLLAAFYPFRTLPSVVRGGLADPTEPGKVRRRNSERSPIL